MLSASASASHTTSLSVSLTRHPLWQTASSFIHEVQTETSYGNWRWQNGTRTADIGWSAKGSTCVWQSFLVIQDHHWTTNAMWSMWTCATQVLLTWLGRSSAGTLQWYENNPFVGRCCIWSGGSGNGRQPVAFLNLELPEIFLRH